MKRLFYQRRPEAINYFERGRRQEQSPGRKIGKPIERAKQMDLCASIQNHISMIWSRHTWAHDCVTSRMSHTCLYTFSEEWKTHLTPHLRFRLRILVEITASRGRTCVWIQWIRRDCMHQFGKYTHIMNGKCDGTTIEPIHENLGLIACIIMI